ncbi:MAG: chalcone isomerase family protein [Thiotrichaceae bacterium]
MKQLTTSFFSAFSIFCLVALLMVPIGASAKDADNKVSDTFSYGGKAMQLNGAGLRKKLFISLYVGSLYLTEKSKDADKIMADDTPMAIRLFIKSSLISPEKMKDATLDGFKKATNGNISAIKPQIDVLLKTFDKGVGPGDTFELINMPGSGIHVVRNGVRAATIRSPEFKKALFGIWLSKNPVQQSLKRKMLGM